MTRRSDLKHWLSELKVRLEMRLANRLFSARSTGVTGVLKRMVARGQEEYTDPDLEHPPPE